MTDEWYEIAWINFTKAILHGCIGEGNEVEKVLSFDERERVYDLNEKHRQEMNALLRELAKDTTHDH